MSDSTPTPDSENPTPEVADTAVDETATGDSGQAADASEKAAVADEAPAEQAAPEADQAPPEADPAPATEAAADEADPEPAADETDPEPAAEAAADKADPEPAAEAAADEADEADEADQAPPEADQAPAAEAAVDEADQAPPGADQAPAAEATADEADEETAEAAAAPAADAGDAGKGEPAMDAEASAEVERLTAAKEAKELLDGKVIGWNKGGYHVAIGKTAAFCPVSQIEIGNPRSPKKYLDRTFKFHVIEIQRGGRRIVVSRATALTAERKAAAEAVRAQLEVGAVLEGRVSNITDFGAFIDLGGKIEGLVHVSEVSRQRVEHAKEKLSVGQRVKVQVIKIEKGGKRISLSMKRLEDDPWQGVADRYSAGQELTGTIVRKTEFGAFIEVEPGLEGLVHNSRLPLGATLESDELDEGTEVQVWVQEVERKRRRMSLSMRPVAEGNPWKGVNDRYPEGDMFEGTVERLADFGAFIELEPGLTGLLPFSVLGGVGNPKRQFQVGKTVSVKVLAIDTDKKRISLGTEQSKAEGNRQDYKEYVKQSKTSSGSGMTAMAAAFEKLKDRASQ